MPAFIDYALAEAQRTNFDVQTIGGIRQYLGGYAAFRKSRAAAKAQEGASAVREREAADRNAYDQDRRRQANILFEQLPPEEQDEISAQASAYAASFGGSLKDTMFALRRTQLTIKGHGDQLKTFEQWRDQRAA